MDKYEDLDVDVDSSFASDYKFSKERFEKIELYGYSRKELEEEYNSFQILLDRITKLSKEYFEEIIHNKISVHDNKMYFDLSSVYISEIQNIYLNRISYRLNQKYNSNSLRLAWIVALVSLVLSLVSIYLTIHYGNSSIEDNVNVIVNDTIDVPLITFPTYSIEDDCILPKQLDTDTIKNEGSR